MLLWIQTQKECTSSLGQNSRRYCEKGWWIVDADIKGYFNNINHEKINADGETKDIRQKDYENDMGKRHSVSVDMDLFLIVDKYVK